MILFLAGVLCVLGIHYLKSGKHLLGAICFVMCGLDIARGLGWL